MSNKNLYLTKPQLKAELEKCLGCRNMPCTGACPVSCSPQEFIAAARKGDFSAAVKIINRNNPLGQTCGLICPDKFCMHACTRCLLDYAINIPAVQASLMEYYRSPDEKLEVPEANGRRIAIIGAGPAGMAAAWILLKQGFTLDVFEAGDKIGGALNLIPESRLPHAAVEKDWNYIYLPERLTLHLNTRIENYDALLLQGFDGVIAAGGEPFCTALNIEGEEHSLSFMEYLRHSEKYQTTGNVAVIGGGLVAVDCALVAKAGRAEHVEMFVRRQLSNMKITRAEYLELLEQRIDVSTMTSPEKIVSENGRLSLFTRKNRFENGILKPLPDSSIKRPDFDLIIRAIGSYADPAEDKPRILYAGDVKTGASTAVEAMASGINAARKLAAEILGA